MKIHVLVNPRNPTGLANRIDPFAVHGFKYIKHLSKYYEMYHYGIAGANVDCEHIDVPAIERNGDVTAFNQAAGAEIKKRASDGDIIACFFGVENRIACEMNPNCKVVEPSIGYRTGGIFAPYRVFTSYAQMHMFYGEKGMLMNPSWFDEVIPNPFTVSEFEFNDKKEDYYLCFGRVCREKGIDLAIQVTEKLGKKLVIAGPGDLRWLGYDRVPDHVEMFGAADAEQRKQLMKNAKALFGLTYYVEPFGNMVVEANLSGTPVITTDWGGFSETVVDKVTGYRVRDFSSLIQALQNIQEIDPLECRNHGLTFSDEAVHERHRKYIEKVKTNNFYAE